MKRNANTHIGTWLSALPLLFLSLATGCLEDELKKELEEQLVETIEPVLEVDGGGNPKVGVKLQATTKQTASGWTASWTWYRNDAMIPKETTKEYTLLASDVGKKFKVGLQFSKGSKTSELAYSNVIDFPKPGVNFTGHEGIVNAVAFSPDGKQAVSAASDHTLKLWKVADGTLVRTFSGHTASVRSVAFSPNGLQIVSGSEDKTAKVWKLSDGSVVASVDRGSHVVKVLFLDDEKFVTSTNSEVQITKTEGKAPVGDPVSVTGPNDVALFVAPNNVFTLAYNRDSDLILWDLGSNKKLFTLKGHTNHIRGIVFSADGKHVFSASQDKTVKQWKVADGTPVRTFTEAFLAIEALSVSRDNKHLLTGSLGLLRLWTIADGKQVKTIKMAGENDDVESAVLSPDGTKALSSGATGGFLGLWDIP